MNRLENLISNYQPSAAAVEIVKNSNITLLVGITGAGKDTIKRQLLRLSDYKEIISHTTRPPRMNGGVMEVAGKDYYFIDNQKAIDMLENKEFIEAKLVHGEIVYGTSLAEVERASQGGSIATTDIDVQGVAEYKLLSPNVIALFIIPPNCQIWQKRLKSRYETPAEFAREWPKRRESAIRELEYALSVPYFHFIINDELDRTVRVAREITSRGDTYLRQDDEARPATRVLLDEIKTL